MPAAKPSKASVAQVLTAITSAGLMPKAIRVAADGSFVVETGRNEALAESTPPAQDEPRRFGQTR